MDILKAFSLLDEEFSINIQGTLENPLFQANQIGKLLGISNIRDAIKDFSDKEKGVGLTDTLGGTQNLIFLTELGLYRILGRSRKPIAHKFQEWMVHVLKEIRITGMYKLKQEAEIDKQLLMHKCDLDNHNIFLNAYDRENVVYICKLNKIGDKLLIKIGYTNNIKERMGIISNTYNGEPFLLEVFESNQAKKIEFAVHHHEFILQYYEQTFKKDGTITRETYLVNDEQYIEFVKIINQLHKTNKSINSIEYEESRLKAEEAKAICIKLEIQNEELKMKHDIESKNIKLKIIELKIKEKEFEIEILKNKKEIKEEIKEDENIDEELSDSDTESIQNEIISPINHIKQRVASARAPKVYQYDPTDLTNYIKIFESPADVERMIDNISPAPLKSASKNNTIYKGFRWYFALDRKVPPPQTIEETVISKNKSPLIRFIAMIDIKQTKIMEVFQNQKAAVEARNMKCNSFTRAINEKSISSGHYWNYFDDCSEEMKAEYLSRSVLPEKFHTKCGKSVQQIDPKTVNIIEVFHSNREVIKKFQISSITLRKISDTDIIHNGYKWRVIENA